MAPFLAPIFFPTSDPIVALILIYGIKSMGFFTRPLGSLFFGNLARKYCIKKLLAMTLSGVALSTFCIGFIPGYASIGVAAPIILAILRAIQGFFAAGEHNIAALFILDQIKDEKAHGRSSSYYLFSTMMGTLLASLAAWLVSISPDPTYYWRIAFIIGISTGILGLILRYHITFYENSISEENANESSIAVLSKYKWKIIKLIPISSFTFVTYSIPFIFLNNIAPHVSEVKVEDLLMYSTLLVTLNNLLIPLFGHVAEKFDITKWMAAMSGLFTITIIPLFAAIPYLGIHGITIVKLWVIVIGVAFVAPFNAFLYKTAPGKEKYLVSGFGYAIGTELLGRNTTAICLGLFHWSHNLYLSGLYVALVALLATVSLVSEINELRAQKATLNKKI